MNPTRDRRIQTLRQMEQVPTQGKIPTGKPVRGAVPVKPKSWLDELPDWVGMVLGGLFIFLMVGFLGFSTLSSAAKWWDALRLSTEGRSSEATITACEFRESPGRRRISYRVTCETRDGAYIGPINLTAFHEFWPNPKPKCGAGCGSYTYKYNLPSPRTLQVRYLPSDPSVIMVGKGGDSAWTLMRNNHGSAVVCLCFAIGFLALLLLNFFQLSPTTNQKTQS